MISTPAGCKQQFLRFRCSRTRMYAALRFSKHAVFATSERDHEQALGSMLMRASVIAACWFIFAFLVVAICSMHYPYPLEWMEGQTIDVLARLQRGESLYVAPTVNYVPFIYPPLYYHIASLFVSLFGLDFFAARLLSVFAAVGVGWVLFLWLRREGATSSVGLIGAGLFFSCYILSSRWLDIARIDSLYLFFLLCAAYLLCHARGYLMACAGGLLMAAAFFTKQNSLIAFSPLLLVLLVQKPRLVAPALLLAVASGAAFFAWYNAATDGWMRYYLFEVPASHRIDRRYLLAFWTEDLLAPLAPLILLVVAGAHSLWRDDRARFWRYLALCVGFMAAAYAGRLHRYGWANVLMPAHAVLALCAAWTLAHWQQRGKTRNMMLGLALMLLQMSMLLYSPAPHIPDADARARADRIMERIANISGPVFMPDIQFVQTRWNKTSYSYGFAAIDVLQSQTSRPEAKAQLQAEMRALVAQHYFSAVVGSSLLSRYALSEYYEPVERLEYLPIFAGYQPRRLTIWMPKARVAP